MDVSELPVSKSGGPRVDVDALEAELEDSRLDASTTAGQLADALAQVEALKAENDELRGIVNTPEMAYVMARRADLQGANMKLLVALKDKQAAEAERDTLAARCNMLIDQHNELIDDMIADVTRGDTYRARALALVHLAQRWHKIYSGMSEFCFAVEAERDEALAAQQGALESLRALPFVGEPLCIVCQQYNLVKHIMAQIDAQPDSGGEIYDDAVSAIYNVADTSMVTLCHDHQDGPSPVGQAAAEAQPGRAKG